jgi:NAD(P)-dependent dehydrogenase (short-subunit alcohol dehydrogenase family)
MPLTAAQLSTLETTSLKTDHKTAVIVGGTTGIGAGIARRLAKLGCKRIIIVGRDAVKGESTVEVLKSIQDKADGFQATFVRGDVS